MAAEKGRTHFGNQLLATVGITAKLTWRNNLLAIQSGQMAGGVSQLMEQRAVICFRGFKRLRLRHTDFIPKWRITSASAIMLDRWATGHVGNDLFAFLDGVKCAVGFWRSRNVDS